MALQIVRNPPIPNGFHRGQFELPLDSSYTFTVTPNPYLEVGTGAHMNVSLPISSGNWEELPIDSPALEALYFRMVNPEFRLLYDASRHKFQDYLKSSCCRRLLRRSSDGGFVRLQEQVHECRYVCAFPNIYGCGLNGTQCALCATFTSQMKLKCANKVKLPSIADEHLFNGGAMFSEYLFTQFSRSLVAQVNALESATAQSNLRAIEVTKAMKRKHEDAVAKAAANGYRLGAMFGRQITVPRSIEGSPMYYKHFLEAAYAVVGKYGRGYDLFVTVVGDTNCPDVNNSMCTNKGKFARFHQHDLLARAFANKLRALEQDILDGGLLGPIVDYLRSIEYQRWGIPHAHFLAMLERKLELEDIDRICTVELPDLDSEEGSKTWQLMLKHNLIHICDPHICGGDANQSGCGCRKRCLNEPAESTHLTGDGRVVHRCITKECGGRYAEVNYVGSNTAMQGGRFTVDSRRVMPYNPYFLRKYELHICVKIITFNLKPDYAIKYPLKGHEFAYCQAISNKWLPNQAAAMKCAVRLGPEQCAIRLLCSDLHIIRHEHMSVRLNKIYVTEQHGTIIFREDANAASMDEAIEKGLAAKDHASEFFAVNARSTPGDLCRTLQFGEFPYYYLTNVSPWTPRVKAVAKPIVVIPTTLRPNHGEVYFMNLLLHSSHSCGKTSRTELRTVNRVVHPSYESAAASLGMITSPLFWDKSLYAHMALGPALLFDLFCNLIINQFVYVQARRNDTELTMLDGFFDAEGAWKKWWQWFVFPPDFEDELVLLHEFRRRLFANACQPDNFEAFLKCLDAYAAALQPSTLNELPDVDPDETSPSVAEYKWLYWPKSEAERIIRVKRLNDDVKQMSTSQHSAYERLVSALGHDSIQGDKSFFMDGRAGAGKSFVIDCVIEFCDTHNHIVLVCSSTGVNALNLRHCRTMHGMFSVPIDADAHSRSSIERGDSMADLIAAASALVYDESFVHSKYALEVVNKVCGDMRSNIESLFGGLLFLGCGDWRQTLPIADGVRGHEDSISMCLVNWEHWPDLTRLPLEGNMRLERCKLTMSKRARKRNQKFAAFLQKIGDGMTGSTLANAKFHSRKHVKLPSRILSDTREDLISTTFSDVFDALHDSPDLVVLEEKLTNAYASTSLLALTIKDTVELNDMMLQDVHSRLRKLNLCEAPVFSYDARDVECNVCYSRPTAEVLGAQVSGLPPFQLNLCIFSVVLLLRNVDLSRGLANGTRLLVLGLSEDFIKVKILSGKPGDTFYHQIRIITRMRCQRRKNGHRLSICQFPLTPAWAITIHKAQGQSVVRLGVYLRSVVFCHGQLYVALSRGMLVDNIRVFIGHEPLVDGRHSKRTTMNMVSCELAQKCACEEMGVLV